MVSDKGFEFNRAPSIDKLPTLFESCIELLEDEYNRNEAQKIG